MQRIRSIVFTVLSLMIAGATFLFAASVGLAIAGIVAVLMLGSSRRRSARPPATIAGQPASANRASGTTVAARSSISEADPFPRKGRPGVLSRPAFAFAARVSRRFSFKFREN